MNDLLKQLILDNIKLRLEIATEMETARVQHIVLNAAHLRCDKDGHLYFSCDSDVDKKKVRLRIPTSIIESVKEFNGIRHDLMGSIKLMTPEDRLETLEFMRNVEKEDRRKFVRSMKQIGQLPRTVGDEEVISKLITKYVDIAILHETQLENTTKLLEKYQEEMASSELKPT